MIRTGVVTRVLWSSRHKTYSLNWEESTPPPHDAFTLKPFRNRRSRTCREQGVTVSALLHTHVHTIELVNHFSRCIKVQLRRINRR